MGTQGSTQGSTQCSMQGFGVQVENGIVCLAQVESGGAYTSAVTPEVSSAAPGQRGQTSASLDSSHMATKTEVVRDCEAE